MIIQSDEELYYTWYLKELEEAGYINSWGNAISYPLGDKLTHVYEKQMKTKVKEESQTILDGSEYTPDFQINWTTKAEGIFYNRIVENKKIDLKLMIADTLLHFSIIEIKPSYDQNNMTRLNTLNRKWMLQRYGIFVNLVKVPDIFKTTFTPTRYLSTNTGKQQRVIHFETRTLEEYVRTKPFANIKVIAEALKSEMNLLEPIVKTLKTGLF